MFSLGILRHPARRLEIADNFLARTSPIIMTMLLTLSLAAKYLVVMRSDGGGDLLGADIPKSLMLLNRQNPYSTQPWAAPYPPLLLLLLGGIIRLTSFTIPPGQGSLSLLSRNIMVAGIFADLLTAVLIFMALRARRASGLQLVIPPAVFLLLPSISLTPYFYFHSDVFGYAIVAGSVLALEKARNTLGISLLSLASIFKIHPLLAVVLAILWLSRKNGLRQTIPAISMSLSIIFTGLVLPLTIPGYSATVLGFNLSTGFGNGTGSFSIMDLFYGVVPSILHLSIDPLILNQIWVLATTALFILAAEHVWKRAKLMHSAEVILIGLLVWLIPLRQLYTHYVVWAVVPFLARGKVIESLTIAGMMELANTMAVWSWNIPPNPVPALSTAFGFFVTSLAYLALDSTSLAFAMRDHGNNKLARQHRPEQAFAL